MGLNVQALESTTSTVDEASGLVGVTDVAVPTESVEVRTPGLGPGALGGTGLGRLASGSAGVGDELESGSALMITWNESDDVQREDPRGGMELTAQSRPSAVGTSPFLQATWLGNERDERVVGGE